MRNVNWLKAYVIQELGPLESVVLDTIVEWMLENSTLHNMTIKVDNKKVYISGKHVA